MMTVDQMISVLQAYKQGNKIQKLVPTGYDTAEWQDAIVPAWSFNRTYYRVKPEPREFYLNLDGRAQVLQGILADRSINRPTGVAGTTVIKVKEVLE